MASLKGTETHKNLMRAFAGESQARNRYTFYAGIAQKQGYPLVADDFLTIPLNRNVCMEKSFLSI